MKRMILAVLAAVAMFALSGCGSDNNLPLAATKANITFAAMSSAEAAPGMKAAGVKTEGLTLEHVREVIDYDVTREGMAYLVLALLTGLLLALGLLLLGRLPRRGRIVEPLLLRRDSLIQ